MKSLKLSPSKIHGTITAPASKSMMQRAIAAALLSPSPSLISNATYSNDSRAALEVIRALGAGVEVDGQKISVNGGMKPTGDVLNFGESGLGIRMFTPIAALWHEPLTLKGEGSLVSRPVTMIEGPLQQLGVKVETNNGFPPMTITGPIKAGEARVDGSISSQFLTGLLMALPMVDGDSTLIVNDLKSTPYIDMTLTFLERCGVVITHENYRLFHIKGNQQYNVGKYAVEGDWSGASFPLVAGAIAGEVTVSGMDLQSPQADRRIMDALQAAGAHIKIDADKIHLKKNKLNAFEFDATHCPDLFPPLVALACQCKGTTRIKGVERLTHKESNRAAALEKEFTTLGGKLRINGDWMEIDYARLNGGIVDSHNDHRIAMAEALAALNAAGDVVINGPGCVAKSYPGFYEDYQAIGGIVHE